MPDLIVKLHHYRRGEGCLADLTVTSAGVQLTDVPVTVTPEGVFADLTDRECPDPVTAESAICAEFRAAEDFVTRFLEFDADTFEIPRSLPAPFFRFYSVRSSTVCTVDVTMPGSDLTIRGINLSVFDGGDGLVRLPVGTVLPPELPEETLKQVLLERFQTPDRLNDPFSLQVTFGERAQLVSCLVDLALPGKQRITKSFMLKALGSRPPRITTPARVGIWNDSRYPWHRLVQQITAAFRAWQAGEVPTPPPAPVPMERKPAIVGRTSNAANNPYRFYPGTALRLVPGDRKLPMAALVQALTKGRQGGIGPLEISCLCWIEQLRYVTTSMLLDLATSGHLSIGWRQRVDGKTMSASCKLMNSFDLVSLTQFVQVNDDGTPAESRAHANYHILTLGQTGSVMLHELGKANKNKFNEFDIYQDGNTAKRFLSANQWLIYWLSHFADAVGDNYAPGRIVYQRSEAFNGARFYATVTCGGCTMVAEPVRRGESFEQEADAMWLRNKFERLISLFEHRDELYCGPDELSFPHRPVLVYICEDDEHILELQEILSEGLAAHPEQTVWYTTDLRIYNADNRGARFLTGPDLTPIDLKTAVGTDEA